MITQQTMCFVDTFKADMATKIIIKFVIVIKKNATSASEKKIVYQYQKKTKKNKNI